MAVGKEAVDDLTQVMLAYYTENVAVESRPYDGLIDVLNHLSDEGAILAARLAELEKTEQKPAPPKPITASAVKTDVEPPIAPAPPP